MDIKEYIKQVNKKTNKFNDKAKNPFLEYSFSYNPFISAIEQTYIWVERNTRRNSNQEGK